ncbi:MAG TPA: Rieske 2Fe-2S domain-containing protein [Acidimicrobiales bacterium]|nr:Rieske 2Fe-2S domain-containing protein [Acidimicrobiales bacterium]
MRVNVGTVDDLRARGFLTGKAGAQPVCVFWHEGRAYALDDRCPHMGFPLHRGTVENGLLTCHWHHARFDLSSGGTMNLFADDVRAYPVDIEDGCVVVVVEDGPSASTGGRAAPEPADRHRRRLAEGLEQGLTLVTAKATVSLLDGGVPVTELVRTGVDFGTTYRDAGWGAGLTVLVAMANVAPHLDAEDRALALVHGLAFVSRDTRGRPPSFPLRPLGSRGVAPERLAHWYRRFIDGRNTDAAERTLLTALETGVPLAGVAAMMTAAATDHVFLDGGHTIDFTNKAFEAVGMLGEEYAPAVLASLVPGTARAGRSEEQGQWRHPHDLAGLVAEAAARLPALAAQGEARRGSWDGVSGLAWAILGDDPAAIVEDICGALAAGATPEQLGRAVAFAAGLRITRFHTQNDHGDWDAVHHGFTAANALHQALVRAPSTDVLRGVLHGALRVYLDRFLNVPPARPPRPSGSVDLGDLQACWDTQGQVDEAGSIAYGWVVAGNDQRALVAALGKALLAEDAGFHWYQIYEAAVRQAAAWPPGSEEGALLLAGCARFLAAHTPTRRELAQVVRIASRLRRGETLFEEA